MPKIDAAKLWALNYRLLVAVIGEVAPRVAALGLDPKELFLLAAVDEHPRPAALAAELLMPKPTVTMMVKRLEASGFLRRAIDPSDLRGHRLELTAAGRKVTTRGLALLSAAFAARLDRLTAAQRADLARILDAMS